jgi:drug/metabolite transporter (DMT)-like permease
LPGLEGKGLRLFWLGTIGFTGFNLLAYTGLDHARPESASLIVALGPLLTALVLWRRTRARPSAATFVLLGLALTGVALSSAAAALLRSSTARSAGAMRSSSAPCSASCSTASAPRFPTFSPLRYTALTAALGWVSIAAATAVAIGSGLVSALRPPGLVDRAADRLPHPPGRLPRSPHLERGDRLIGPQNTVFFGNLIPVTTFAIEIARGYRPNAVELGGAALTISALVASNVLARRSRPAHADKPSADEAMPAAA